MSIDGTPCPWTVRVASCDARARAPEASPNESSEGRCRISPRPVAVRLTVLVCIGWVTPLSGCFLGDGDPSKAAWDEAKWRNTVEAYEQFQRDHHYSPHVDAAAEAARELKDGHQVELPPVPAWRRIWFTVKGVPRSADGSDPEPVSDPEPESPRHRPNSLVIVWPTAMRVIGEQAFDGDMRPTGPTGDVTLYVFRALPRPVVRLWPDVKRGGVYRASIEHVDTGRHTPGIAEGECRGVLGLTMGKGRTCLLESGRMVAVAEPIVKEVTRLSYVQAIDVSRSDLEMARYFGLPVDEEMRPALGRPDPTPSGPRGSRKLYVGEGVSTLPLPGEVGSR